MIIVYFSLIFIHRIHVYVSRSDKDPAYYSLVKSGKVDSTNRVPKLYDYETQNVCLKLNCSKSLFISSQVSILSANVKKEIQPTIQIWKCFETNIWILICFAFIFIIIKLLL
jgi:hypothetical protein